MDYSTISNRKHLFCCKTDSTRKKFQHCKSANPPSIGLNTKATSKATTRYVQPFSIQSQQKNTLVVYGRSQDEYEYERSAGIKR